MSGPTLAESMCSAWGARATTAAAFVRAAEAAPGLFEPEAIAEAVGEFERAVIEFGRWSA